MEQKKLYECVHMKAYVRGRLCRNSADKITGIGVGQPRIWTGQAIPEWWVNLVRNLHSQL